MAEGSRGARHRGAGRLGRVRARRGSGPGGARAARAARRAGVHPCDGRGRGDRGDGVPHRVHGRGGRRAPLPGRGRCRPLGRGARARRHPVRARRARHAAPRGLLSAARIGHLAGDRRDLGRARLDVRARDGVHGRRGAAPREGGGARAEARRLRHGGEGRSRVRGWRSRAAARSPPAPTRPRSTSASGWDTSRAPRRAPRPSSSSTSAASTARPVSSRSRSTGRSSP